MKESEGWGLLRGVKEGKNKIRGLRYKFLLINRRTLVQLIYYTMKNSHFSPKANFPRQNHKSPQTQVTASISTNAEIQKSVSGSQESRPEQLTAERIRTEINRIRTDMSKIMEKDTMWKEKEKKNENVSTTTSEENKSVVPKRLNFQTSPRFSRKKGQEINPLINKSPEDVSRFLSDLDILKNQLKKKMERETKMMSENTILLQEIKELKKANQRLQSELKEKKRECKTVNLDLISESQKMAEERKGNEKIVKQMEEKIQTLISAIKNIEENSKIQKNKLTEELKKNQKVKNQQIEHLNLINNDLNKQNTELKQKVKQIQNNLEKLQQQIDKVVQNNKGGKSAEKNPQQTHQVMQKIMKQNAALRLELGNREKTMHYMFNDIKEMQKQMKSIPFLEWQIKEHLKLIEQLNQKMIDKEAALLNYKIQQKTDEYANME